MKTKMFFSVLMAGCLLTGTGCSGDDNYLPEDTVLNAFKAKYPDAGRVEWENKQGYKVADFVLNTKESEAWFDDKGNWLLTETDIRFSELPPAIQDHFTASTYADWKIDDVDMLNRPGAEVAYVIEIEQGEQDVDLYYAADGTLLKEVKEGGQNGYEPQALPAAILEKLKALYPAATILAYDREGVHWEVDIRDGGIHKEVLFDNENNWVNTEWDIRAADVPAVVMNAVKASAYGSYKVDDVEIKETPAGTFFVFELESGEKEVYLTVGSDGTIV